MNRHVMHTFYAPEAAAGAGAAAGDKPAGDGAAAGDKGGAADGAEGAKGEKPAGDKPAGDAGAAGDKGSKDGAPTAQPKAPEKYDLKLSDEARTYVDDKDVKSLEGFARGLSMTNEQAQAYVEGHVAGVKQLAATFLEETKADPMFGGDSLEQTQQHATRALDAFAPKGDKYGDMMRATLTKNGYGNNLGILAMLARAGKAMAEDKPGAMRGGGGGGGGDKPKDAATVLYDKTPQK